MSKLIGNIIQIIGPIGVVTNFHFYDEGFKVDKIAIAAGLLVAYFTVIRPKVKVQKARELDEAKSGIQTVKVQAVKTARITSTVLLFASLFVFFGDAIHHLGITLALSAGIYGTGGVLKTYSISKKKSTSTI